MWRMQFVELSQLKKKQEDTVMSSAKTKETVAKAKEIFRKKTLRSQKN